MEELTARYFPGDLAPLGKRFLAELGDPVEPREVTYLEGDAVGGALDALVPPPNPVQRGICLKWVEKEREEMEMAEMEE